MPDAAQDPAPAPAYEALVVDWGGVLTSPLPQAMAEWHDAEAIDGAAFGEVMREWLTTPPGQPDANPVHALETGAMSGPDFERALAARLRTRDGRPVEADGLLQRMFAGFAEEPTMTDVVRRVRAAGLRTALLSNSWANDYPRDVLDALFDVVVISGEVGLRKPDPGIYRLTAERLGVPPERCVFVDDLSPNVRAAAALGMCGVLHRDAATTVAELEAVLGLDLSGTPGGSPSAG